MSALYARRWCHHVGIFPELEEQLATWVPGERSPDRMDALVWALSALFYPTEGGRGDARLRPPGHDLPVLNPAVALAAIAETLG